MNLADYIKAELAAGREVRVKCPLWLADRPEGWVVQGEWPGKDERVVTVLILPGWCAGVPIADCTLVQPPLKVGDRVQTVGTESLATIVGIDDSKGRYWIRYADDDSYNTLRSSDLERLP